MPRLLFEKTGDAVWISHLDLMRLFQRAFKRAGLPLTHTQGYNPRPSVSIAMPLSVGVESICELLDFDLEGEKIPNAQIVRRLNEVLVKGIRVLDCLDNGKKLKELAYLDCKLMLRYDNDVTSFYPSTLCYQNEVSRCKYRHQKETGVCSARVEGRLRGVIRKSKKSAVCKLGAYLVCRIYHGKQR